MLSILQYELEGFDPRHDRPRIDGQVEMERYNKLPNQTKTERLRSALSHSDQSEQYSPNGVRTAN